MDLSPIFNDALARHNCKPLKSHPFNVEDLDHFLAEAYRINYHIADLTSYLRSIRQSYLSVAQPPRRRPAPGRTHSGRDIERDRDSKYLTDSQRDQIDADTKKVLRELNAHINNLADAERVRQDADATIAKKRRHGAALGALGRWAAGGGAFREVKSPEELEEQGRQNALSIYREGVLWYLQRRLERVGNFQSEMVEVRLKREMEKNKSVLYKSGAPANLIQNAVLGSSAAGAGASGASWAAREQDDAQSGGHDTVQLSEEQLQLFEEENRDMLKQYENTLDQVRAAERSLMEISEQHNMLAANLEMQSAHIEQLVQDSHFTSENVGSGNRELKKATERKSTARMVFYGTVAFCTTLVLWDLVI